MNLLNVVKKELKRNKERSKIKTLERLLSVFFVESFPHFFVRFYFLLKKKLSIKVEYKTQ